MNNGKIVYLVRQKSFTELVLEDELSPTNAAQRKRLEGKAKVEKAMPAIEEVVPVAARPVAPAYRELAPTPKIAVMARIRLAKAKKAKKLKLLQLQEAA